MSMTAPDREPPPMVPSADADWLAWIRTNPGTDKRRLLALLDAVQSDLFESRAEVDALNAKIRERDAEIVKLQDELARIRGD